MEADTSHTMEQKTKTQVSSGLQNEKTYIFFFFHLIHGQKKKTMVNVHKKSSLIDIGQKNPS